MTSEMLYELAEGKWKVINKIKINLAVNAYVVKLSLSVADKMGNRKK